MSDITQQVPWTDEQWARVRKAVQEEAARARVAANFLPLVGPLAPNADYVSKNAIGYNKQGRLGIADTETMQLVTLQAKVYLRGAQMADPELASALELFRRSANLLARLEDCFVFRGMEAGEQPVGTPLGSEVLHGPDVTGLAQAQGAKQVERDATVEALRARAVELREDGRAREANKADAEADTFQNQPLNIDPIANGTPEEIGRRLVAAVSDGIGQLEAQTHFGPFAVVLGHALFTAAQTPDRSSLVLPQDRIVPFLGGGPLVRSSTLAPNTGLIIALGSAPIELVVATDVAVNFLQVTTDPQFVFRIYEKIALRVKEWDAIQVIEVQ